MKARLREEAKAITEAQVDSHLVWDLMEEVDGGKVLKDKPDILGATRHSPALVFSQRKTNVVSWQGTSEDVGEDGGDSGGTDLRWRGLRQGDPQASSGVCQTKAPWASPGPSAESQGVVSCIVG